MVRLSNEKLAKQRIIQLFEQAREKHSEEPELSHKYTKLAKKISMKYRIQIPFPYRRQICKSCYSFLGSSASARTRLKDSRVMITCKRCGRTHRIPYAREKKARKAGKT
ncbi:MAG: ribonuclease P [Nanoarchaeota archaeon]|nr:ribonuclease P [Nanoarchaeota archaeon]